MRPECLERRKSVLHLDNSADIVAVEAISGSEGCLALRRVGQLVRHDCAKLSRMYWSSWFTTVKDCLMDSLKGLAERLLASLLQEIPPGDRHIRWLIPETYYFSYYGYLTNV